MSEPDTTDELMQDNYQLSKTVLALIQDITRIELDYSEWAADRAVTFAGGPQASSKRLRGGPTGNRHTAEGDNPPTSH